MMQTIEVRFKGNRRGFFDWADTSSPLRLNEPVLVEVERGLDFGRVNTVGDAALKKCGGCTSCGTSDETLPHEPASSPAEFPLPTESAAGYDPNTQEPLPSPEVLLSPRPEHGASDTVDEQVPFGATADALPTDVTKSSELAPASGRGEASSRSRVVRRASQPEIAQHEDLRRGEETARHQVIERVRTHGLPMRISDAEWQWDKNRLTVYFTAETRVDFRNLVRELAGLFRTRIELRQIGVRGEAARLGGVGRCGREYCCSTWLTAPGPVNLALAKDQHLSLNPAQISGGCGRLLCCLKYEHEFYVASRKRFPKEGKTVRTSRGAEKVVAVDIFRERVFLRSEEHGPRIIPVLDLRDEMEKAAAEPVVGQPESAAPRTPEKDATRPPRPPRRGPPRPGGGA